MSKFFSGSRDSSKEMEKMIDNEQKTEDKALSHAIKDLSKAEKLQAKAEKVCNSIVHASFLYIPIMLNRKWGDLDDGQGHA
jgi:hypothetical protein